MRSAGVHAKELFTCGEENGRGRKWIFIIASTVPMWWLRLKNEEIAIEELLDILSSLEDLAKSRYYSVNSEDDGFLGGVKRGDEYDL